MYFVDLSKPTEFESSKKFSSGRLIKLVKLNSFYIFTNHLYQKKHLEKRGSVENKKDTVHSMINLIRKYQDLYIHVPHNIQEREEE